MGSGFRIRPRRIFFLLAVFCVICTDLSIQAQTDSSAPSITAAPRSNAKLDAHPIDTTRAKWDNFVRETSGPLTLGGSVFNALFSQVTNTDPQYGVNRIALAKRFGASLADIASQNFFGDFVVASVFHEDPRYHRMGDGNGFFRRFGYAISRAVVIRKDTGGDGFNFDNFLGSAMSSGFSNLYYPPPSRTRSAILMHFAIDIADNGFVNLAPEFWPDFRRKVLRHH